MKSEEFFDLLAEHLRSVKRYPKFKNKLCGDFKIDTTQNNNIVSSLSNTLRTCQNLETTRGTETSSICLVFLLTFFAETTVDVLTVSDQHSIKLSFLYPIEQLELITIGKRQLNGLGNDTFFNASKLLILG